MQWTLALCVLALLAGGTAWLVRTFLSGGAPTALFGAKGIRRIGVVETFGIDAKRRLVLIRRDDREHLLLTGGPVDLVIETGIASVRGNGASEGDNGRPQV